jgi:tRNA nucleotidyltransferase (CCA-adding enzyme)
MEAVLKDVLKKITPGEKDRKEMDSALKALLKAADEVTKPLGLDRMVAGSLMRDTWLRDKKEIDLFILFPVSFSREDLEKTGLQVGKDIIKKMKGVHKLAYAEHPYVKGHMGNFDVDIVPCYNVESASKIKSAVDRTPFHNRYIAKNLTGQMSGEVRLLKQFCKSAGVYGSDIKTLGFSGYLCELLIIKFRGFKDLATSAGRWEPGMFIDLEGHNKSRGLDDQYRNQPLIMIDPTDPKRNVAAALSPKNFVAFTRACMRFAKRPDGSFFSLEKPVIKHENIRGLLENRGTGFISIEFDRPDVVDDILFSQLRKTAKRLVGFLEDNDFRIIDADVWSGEKRSCILLEAEVWTLPGTRKLMGPPIFSKQHSEQFVKKYEKDRLYVDGIFWVAFTKRQHTMADHALKQFLARSREELAGEGIGSHLAKSIARGFAIMDNKAILAAASKNRDFSLFLAGYLERNI